MSDDNGRGSQEAGEVLDEALDADTIPGVDFAGGEGRHGTHGRAELRKTQGMTSTGLMVTLVVYASEAVEMGGARWNVVDEEVCFVDTFTPYVRSNTHR